MRLPSGVNARHAKPAGRTKAGSPGLGASSPPGCVGRLSTTSSGRATRRTRMPSLPALAIMPPSGENLTSATGPSWTFWRNTSRSRPRSHNAISPPDSPQSNLAPSGAKARRSTGRLITRLLLKRTAGAASRLTGRPVRTSKISTSALGGLKHAAAISRPSGENATSPMLPSVNSASVPIRSRARGGRGGWAISTLGETPVAGLGVSGMAGACGRAAGDNKANAARQTGSARFHRARGDRLPSPCCTRENQRPMATHTMAWIMASSGAPIGAVSDAKVGDPG